MTIHRHSIDAYYSELPRLTGRAAVVFEWFMRHGRATDRDCMRGLGFTDMNAVRPRITELIPKYLVEVGEVTCPITRKTVRVVDIHRPQQADLFSEAA